jgi:predicted kinase
MFSGVHIICGSSQTGKSTYIKELIKDKSNVFIFDVQNEYKNGCKNTDIDVFLNKAVKLTNYIIVFEEATLFFTTKTRSNHLYNLLISKKHKNNYILLIFHSFADLPKYIRNYAQYITIFKTE